jgi:hypothetical protein
MKHLLDLAIKYLMYLASTTQTNKQKTKKHKIGQQTSSHDGPILQGQAISMTMLFKEAHHAKQRK